MKAEAQARGVLTSILAETAQRLASRSGERAAWERRAAAAHRPPSLVAALGGERVAVIGEVKRRSPSAGAIREGADAVRLARSYAEAGAAAISVLTEPGRFGGSLDDLAAVTREVSLPVLRKDFVIDPLQLYEARAVGAAAVLLIVRAVGGEQLEALAELARALGLETLVEIHGEAELAAARAAGATAIGVNARDLESLAVDGALVERLLPLVPPEVVAVAESGLASRPDVERVARAGADAVLVGTAVAAAPDPGAALRQLVGVARHRRQRGQEGR